MTSLTQAAADNIDHMVDLLHKQIETYRHLQKALLLAELMEVAPRELDRPIYSGVKCRRAHGARPWVGADLLVRIGDGQHRTFPLKDVDKRLWPTDIREAWARWQKSKETRREGTSQ